MQLGKTLVGAVIGAALGIGLLVAIYLLFRMDDVWLAIPVAILTGLGVRTLVSTSGHASYVRGAITGVLALAAYLGGWWVAAQVATQLASAAQSKQLPLADTTEPAEDADDTGAEPAAAAPAPVDRPIPAARPSGAGMAKTLPPGQSPWDYVWLGIAALVAYELGRGTGAKPVVVGEETVTEVPKGAHPDA